MPATPTCFAEWGCRSSEGPPSFSRPLEGRRPRHPHPEASQGGVREAAVKSPLRSQVSQERMN